MRDPAGHDRAQCPRGRRGQDGDHADHRGPVRTAAQAGKQRDADQPERQPGQRREAQPGVVQPRVDTEQPQRHGGDEQRGEPGRHRLLAHADYPVGHEQQNTDDRAARPLRAGRPAEPGSPAAPQGEREHDQAGHQVPRRRHQQRRHRLDPDPDGQVGAAPHHPHDEQANPGRHAGPPRRFRRFLTPNGPAFPRSGPLLPLGGGSQGRVPLAHNHQACQPGARPASGSIAIFSINPAIPGGEGIRIR